MPDLLHLVNFLDPRKSSLQEHNTTVRPTVGVNCRGFVTADVRVSGLRCGANRNVCGGLKGLVGIERREFTQVRPLEVR